MARPAVHKDAIHRAALQLFAQRGFHGVSIRDISRAAGVSEGALYRHHPSKEHLALTLYRKGYDTVVDVLGDMDATAPELESFVSGMVIQLVLFYQRDADLCAYTLFPAGDVLALMPEADTTASERIRAALEKRLVGRQQGDRPPALLTAQLLGCVLYPLVMHQRGTLPGAIDDYMDGMVQSALRIARE